MTETSEPVSFQSKLRARDEVATGTMAFHFDRPKGFTFRAGQATDVTLIDPPETDAEGNTRTFSIASPPSADEVMVATRMRDTAFKRSLKTLPLGTTVRLASPSGSLTLHNDARRAAVILAGGIGITPFRSMIFRSTIEKLPHQITLVFSNHRPEDAPFLEELFEQARNNPNFSFVPTMDGLDKSQAHWTGEVGPISRDLLGRHLNRAMNPIYYTAGPPGFVGVARRILNESGVDDDDIRTEEFSGY